MYDGGIRSVLRCGRCNKPFDKESTLKRHGYYCRSRTVGVKARARSCFSCVKAKAHCDNRRPVCSRCSTKARECLYPATAARDVQNEHGDNDSTTSPSWLANASNTNNLENLSNDATSRSLGKSIDTTLSTSRDEKLDWNIELSDFLAAEDKSLPPVLFAATPSNDSQFQTHGLFPSADVFILPRPYSSFRSITQRPKAKTGPQRIADLILYTLKSYLQMLRCNTLPPFLHPRMASPHIDDSDMEPLSNCFSLLHVINNDISGSRKLFWRDIRLECERFCTDYATFSKWELLAAMQALSIYILVRLDEGETDYNNCDSLLIPAVTVIAKHLNDCLVTCNGPSPFCEHDLETCWKEWIFEESRQRMCIVYQIVNMLVYFEPAAMCDHPQDIILAPLPARKQLWEAGDALSWKADREKRDFQTTFGLATNGDLVNLDNSFDHHRGGESSGGRTRKTAKWEEWCAGMDAFGSLVMLAASLIV